MKQRAKLAVLIVLLCAVSPIAMAATVEYTQVEGVVVEKNSSAPLKGVHVLVKWTVTHYGLTGHDSCTWITATETDASGRYSVKAPRDRLKITHPWWGKPVRTDANVRFFKLQMKGAETSWSNGAQRPRYVPKDSNPTFAMLIGLSSKEGLVTVDGVLQQAVEDSHERLRALAVESRPESRCPSATEAGKVKRFYEAISNEARERSRSPYELALAGAIEIHAADPFGESGKLTGRELTDAALATFGSDLDSRDGRDRTQLMRAAEEGDALKVVELLRAGANPNRTTFSGGGANEPHSALTLAIRKYGFYFNRPADAAKYLSGVKALLQDRRTDPNFRSEKDQCTALMMAVEASQEETVQLLLAAGADPNILVAQESALILAERAKYAGRDDARKVYELIINSSRLSPKEQAASVIRAASTANTETLARLIGNGADLNSRLYGTWTPLICATVHAISNPQIKYVEALKLIASSKTVDKSIAHEGKTALQLATEAKRSDLIALLR